MKSTLALIFVLAYSISIGQTVVSKEGFEDREETIRIINDLLDWVETTIEGQDTAGKNAVFNILVLTQEEEWKFEDTILLESNQPASQVLPTYFDKKYDLLVNSRELICIGTASEEGNPLGEKKRARSRARQLGRIAKKYLEEYEVDKTVFALSLGQFSIKTNMDDTSNQRRLVVVAVDKRSDSNVNLKEALKNAF